MHIQKYAGGICTSQFCRLGGAVGLVDRALLSGSSDRGFESRTALFVTSLMKDFISSIKSKYFSYHDLSELNVLQKITKEIDSTSNGVSKAQLQLFYHFSTLNKEQSLSTEQILEVLNFDQLLNFSFESNDEKILDKFRDEDFMHILKELSKDNESLRLCYEYITVMDNSAMYSNFVEKWTKDPKYSFLYNFQPALASRYTCFTLPDDIPLF